MTADIKKSTKIALKILSVYASVADPEPVGAAADISGLLRLLFLASVNIYWYNH